MRVLEVFIPHLGAGRCQGDSGLTLWGPGRQAAAENLIMLVGAGARGTMLCAAAVGYALM